MNPNPKPCKPWKVYSLREESTGVPLRVHGDGVKIGVFCSKDRCKCRSFLIGLPSKSEDKVKSVASRASCNLIQKEHS